MNSPLPFSIASPPFLRRYVEPSSRSIPRYILFSPIITSFYFFFFPPPPITIHRFSRFSVSVSPTRSSINSASLSAHFSLPFPLSISLFSFPSFFFFSLLFFFNYYPLSFFSSSSPSYPLARTLPFSAPLSFSVVLCIFLLFSFITLSSPPLPFPVAASVSVVPISLFVTPRTTPRCVAVSVRTCVCVCVWPQKGKGESSL